MTPLTCAGENDRRARFAWPEPCCLHHHAQSQRVMKRCCGAAENQASLQCRDTLIEVIPQVQTPIGLERRDHLRQRQTLLPTFCAVRSESKMWDVFSIIGRSLATLILRSLDSGVEADKDIAGHQTECLRRPAQIVAIDRQNMSRWWWPTQIGLHYEKRYFLIATIIFGY